MRAVIASVVVSGVLAVLLLSVSPPSCGCSAEEEFVGELNAHGVSGYTFSDGFTSHAVEAAASRVYSGVPLDAVVAPSAMRQGDCMRSEQSLNCTYVVAAGYLREEQLKLRFVAGPDGKIGRVQVKEVRKWRWE